jgi:hypothetical protein
MSTVEATRAAVQRMLTDLLGRVEVDADGDFSFRVESARVFIGVVPFPEKDTTIVNVFSHTNIDVPPTPELFRHIAVESDEWLFGHLGATEEDGAVTVTFSHRLLGGFLDPEELEIAVLAVATTANRIDDEIQRRFGGRLFHGPGGVDALG